jgi:small-conductance mechanosensitive channel
VPPPRQLASALLALHTVGVPLAALLTFGGVGGLALGLAAQVAAANIVAGACLLIAQPFRVGDKVDLPGRGLTGFVDRFSIDNTVITLADTSVVTVPNAELAKSAIRNLSRMSFWRVTATFRVPYGNLRDVRQLAARLEEYCRGRADFAEAPPRVVCRVVLGGARLRARAAAHRRGMHRWHRQMPCNPPHAHDARKLRPLAEVGANAADYALPIHVTTFFKAPGVTLPEFERRQHDILLDLGARPLRWLTRGVALAVQCSRVHARACCVRRRHHRGRGRAAGGAVQPRGGDARGRGGGRRGRGRRGGAAPRRAALQRLRRRARD